MRSSSLFLLLLVISLSGCIVTYRDFPVPRSAPPVDGTISPAVCYQTIQFSYAAKENGGTYVWTSSGLFSPAGLAPALESALHRYAGCRSSRALFTSMRPDTKVRVSVEEKPYLWRWYGEYLGRISSKFYLLLPFYIDEGGWELSYSIIQQNKLKRTFTYQITARQFYWLLLLPFSWINVFTYSLDDAVRSTTAQFAVDARQEGYLEDLVLLSNK